MNLPSYFSKAALHKHFKNYALVTIGLSWAAGVFAESNFLFRLNELFILSALLLLLIFLCWKKVTLRNILLILLFFILGTMRTGMDFPQSNQHSIALKTGQALTIQGWLSGGPNVTQNGEQIEVTSKSLQMSNNTSQWVTFQAPFRVNMQKDTDTLSYGDQVEIQGIISNTKNSSSSGTVATISFARISVMHKGFYGILSGPLQWLRNAMEMSIGSSLPEPAASILIGIVLGIKTPTMRTILPLFIQTGTIHLITTSGYKITLLTGFVLRLLATRFNKKWAHAASIGFIIIYVLIVGATPAAIRAGIMGSILLLGAIVGRRYSFPAALALATIVMSAFNPSILWDMGFQITVAGTAGIVWIAPLIFALLSKIWPSRFVSIFIEIIAVTLAVQIFTLPISLANFGDVSILSPIVNLLVLPLFLPLLLLGILTGIAGIVVSPLAKVTGYICWPLLEYTLRVIQYFGHLTFSNLSFKRISSLQEAAIFIAFPVLLLVINRMRFQLHKKSKSHLMEVKFQLGFACILIVVISLGTLLNIGFTDQTKIIFLNNAAGEAAIVEGSNGSVSLINSSETPTATQQTLAENLPFWQRSVNLALLTDTHSSTINSTENTLQHFHADYVIESGMLYPSSAYATWNENISNLANKRIIARKGYEVKVDNTTVIQILNPPDPLFSTSSTDSNDLIFEMNTTGARILFLGSANAEAITEIMSSQEDIKADILVIDLPSNESESRSAALNALVSAINPQMIIADQLQGKTTKNAADSFDKLLPNNIPIIYSSDFNTLTLTSSNHGWAFTEE